MLRDLSPSQSLSHVADRFGLTGELHLGEIEAFAAPRQPWVTEVVVFDRQRRPAQVRVDVVSPHGTRLEQVLIDVDDHAVMNHPSRLPWRATLRRCGPRKGRGSMLTPSVRPRRT